LFSHNATSPNNRISHSHSLASSRETKSPPLTPPRETKSPLFGGAQSKFEASRNRLISLKKPIRDLIEQEKVLSQKKSDLIQELVCPISREFVPMPDAVTLEGFLFHRDEIQDWISLGKKVHPLTGQVKSRLKLDKTLPPKYKHFYKELFLTDKLLNYCIKNGYAKQIEFLFVSLQKETKELGAIEGFLSSDPKEQPLVCVEKRKQAELIIDRLEKKVEFIAQKIHVFSENNEEFINQLKNDFDEYSEIIEEENAKFYSAQEVGAIHSLFDKVSDFLHQVQEQYMDNELELELGGNDFGGAWNPMIFGPMGVVWVIIMGTIIMKLLGFESVPNEK
jgi:hypothetical protein